MACCHACVTTPFIYKLVNKELTLLMSYVLAKKINLRLTYLVNLNIFHLKMIMKTSVFVTNK